MSTMGLEGGFRSAQATSVSQTTALMPFWVGPFFAVWSCPVHRGMFSNVLGLHPLVASSTSLPSPPSSDSPNCLQASSPGRQTLPWLGTSALEQAVRGGPKSTELGVRRLGSVTSQPVPLEIAPYLPRGQALNV